MEKIDVRPICRGYIRVSTIMQSTEGVSLETQVKKIKAHCEYKNWNLVKIYTDAGISGKDVDRPELQALLKDMNKDEYVVVSDLSRLSRNTYQALSMFEQFKSKGVKFVCLNPDLDFSTSIGELIFTVLMSVYKLERQNISVRVSDNLQRLSKEGKLRSRAPFGWKYTGRDHDLEPEPGQQRIIEKIKAMHAGGMKMAQIAKTLNNEGENRFLLNNKKQTPEDKIPIFYTQTIKRILLDQGIITSDKVKRPPLEQRIVSHHKSLPIFSPPQ